MAWQHFGPDSNLPIKQQILPTSNLCKYGAVAIIITTAAGLWYAKPWALWYAKPWASVKTPKEDGPDTVVTELLDPVKEQSRGQPAPDKPSGSPQLQNSDSGSTWACPACTFENPSGAASCEMCGTVNREALQGEDLKFKVLFLFFGEKGSLRKPADLSEWIRKVSANDMFNEDVHAKASAVHEIIKQIDQSLVDGNAKIIVRDILPKQDPKGDYDYVVEYHTGLKYQRQITDRNAEGKPDAVPALPGGGPQLGLPGQAWTCPKCQMVPLNEDLRKKKECPYCM